MYVCNCNGIRERDVHGACESGAGSVGEVFLQHKCKVQCGRCVQEMQSFLNSVRNNLAAAAE
jgi:bacterioferritin-associated ferredoxin